MPRKSRSSSSGSRSQSRSRSQSGGQSRSQSQSQSRSHYYTPAAYQSHSPAPTDEKRSGGLGSAVVQGIGWSIGSRIVGALLGPPTIRHKTVESSAAPRAPSQTVTTPKTDESCAIQSKDFQDCLIDNRSDINKCQFFMDMLYECRNKPINSDSTIIV